MINVDLTSASGHGCGGLPDMKSVCVCVGGCCPLSANSTTGVSGVLSA